MLWVIEVLKILIGLSLLYTRFRSHARDITNILAQKPTPYMSASLPHRRVHKALLVDAIRDSSFASFLWLLKISHISVPLIIIVVQSYRILVPYNSFNFKYQLNMLTRKVVEFRHLADQLIFSLTEVAICTH